VIKVKGIYNCVAGNNLHVVHGTHVNA